MRWWRAPLQNHGEQGHPQNTFPHSTAGETRAKRICVICPKSPYQEVVGLTLVLFLAIYWGCFIRWILENGHPPINKLLIRLWAWFTHLLSRNISKTAWGSYMHFACIGVIHFHARLSLNLFCPSGFFFFFLTKILSGICIQNSIWVSQGCYWLSVMF